MPSRASLILVNTIPYRVESALEPSYTTKQSRQLPYPSKVKISSQKEFAAWNLVTTRLIYLPSFKQVGVLECSL